MELDEFAPYMVDHRLLREAEEKVYNAIHDPSDTSLIYLFGPSGVGKSTLLGGLMRRLAKNADEKMADDPGHLPYLAADATPPENGPFSFKELYRSILESAREFGLDWKVTDERWHAVPSAAALRRVLVNIVRERSVPVLIIDEVPHIGDAGSGRVLLDRLDVLKSLAIATKVPLVLAGTYRLKRFSDLSDQASRRTEEVHFPRYAPAGDGYNDFSDIADHLLSLLPLKTGSSEALSSYLYDGSVGCVGVLKNWLVRAALVAERSSSSRLTRAHLDAARKSRKQLEAMAKAIKAGESDFVDDERDLSHVRSALGRADAVPDPRPAEPAASAVYRTPPGRRKPARLRTGAEMRSV